MKKLYRYFKLHMKTAYKSITRHLGLTFSATVAVSITLILISAFLLITGNLSNFTYRIEEQVTIRASIDNIVKEDEKAALFEQIGAIEHVKQVTFSSGDDELNAYKEEYSDEKGLFSMYEGKSNPIRDTFIIEVSDGLKIQQVTKEIRTLKGIASVDFGGASTSDLIKGFEAIREGGFIFIAFLVLIAVFLIANKIKMSIYTRKNEIAIMRFVGASNSSIKFPMMFEGAFIGLLGSIVPIALTIFGYQYIYRLLDGEVLTSMLTLKDVFPFTSYISLLLIAIGMGVGLVGSFFSTTRYLRWKR